MNRKKSHRKISFGFFVCVKIFNPLKNYFHCGKSKQKSLFRLLGGGTVRWGAERSGMKKVLLGESEVLTPVKSIVKSKFVQNMDKS